MWVYYVVGAVLVLAAFLVRDFPSAVVMFIAGLVVIFVTVAKHENPAPPARAPLPKSPVPAAPTAPPPSVQSPPIRAASAASIISAPVADPLPPEPSPPTPRIPEIVTRTGESSDTRLHDPYADVERTWSRNEERQLIELLDEGVKIEQIGQRLRIDQRQVAIRLVRLVLGATGELDDHLRAARHGSRYDKQEIAKIRADLLSQRPLIEIAQSVDRTPLGVGWRIIDSRPQIVFASYALRATLGIE